jgi:hypothetical protein
MDLCKLVDIGNERQKREEWVQPIDTWIKTDLNNSGKFPDLSETTIFTELIRGYTRPAGERERVSLEKKMGVPENDDDE